MRLRGFPLAPLIKATLEVVTNRLLQCTVEKAGYKIFKGPTNCMQTKVLIAKLMCKKYLWVRYKIVFTRKYLQYRCGTVSMKAFEIFFNKTFNTHGRIYFAHTFWYLSDYHSPFEYLYTYTTWIISYKS